MSDNIDFEFGRSIGATHYSLGDDDYHFAWIRFGAGFKEIYVPAEGSHAKWFIARDWDRDSIAIADQWTIHNNTLPLRELSDEQAAQLVNAWRMGAELQYKSEDGFSRSLCGFTSKDAIYRIKPKSARAEFIERCMVAAGQEPLVTGMGFKDAYNAIFDAIQCGDIKAPTPHKE